MTAKPTRLSAEPPRGMRDILPDEAELRDWTTQTILTVYRSYGFRRVETPALERVELLTQGQGGENEKLIFKVLKRGEKLDLARAESEADLVDLGLRFDLTVPLTRYYAHNQARLPKPLKAVQIGPVWRAERPQRGRLRQFTQCDIDVLGDRSEVADIEVILATTDALAALGLKDLTVRLNDRRILTAMVRACGFDDDRHESVFITLDKWDKVAPDAIREELIHARQAQPAVDRLMERFSDLKAGGELPASVGDPAAREGRDRLKRIQESIGRQLVRFDATLVRGMSYYTGPIFEITSARFPSSIAGGGRYDGLIGKILGQDVPATGFSIGFERVVSILSERGGGEALRSKRVALLFEEPKYETETLKPVLDLARDLRDQGYAVSLEIRGRRRGPQLAALAAHGFDGFVEAPDGRVQWFGGRG